jgi:FKBP-type peptidyl-prolyl cis-trans isomerase
MSVNVTADGGVTKKIIEEGQGGRPSAGSTVAGNNKKPKGIGKKERIVTDCSVVQYTGTLTDGTEFDSSSGGYPFTFELGTGTNIK